MGRTSKLGFVRRVVPRTWTGLGLGSSELCLVEGPAGGLKDVRPVLGSRGRLTDAIKRELGDVNCRILQEEWSDGKISEDVLLVAAGLGVAWS